MEGLDFGKNWDGAYQDVVPTLTQFFQKQGFHTTMLSEWESESRESELVAMKEALVVRIPWAEDLQGRSVVNLQTLQVHKQIRSSSAKL